MTLINKIQVIYLFFLNKTQVILLSLYY